jgi:hypothetical protein
MKVPETFTPEELLEIQLYIADPTEGERFLSLGRRMSSEEVEYIVWLANESENWIKLQKNILLYERKKFWTSARLLALGHVLMFLTGISILIYLYYGK